MNIIIFQKKNPNETIKKNPKIIHQKKKLNEVQTVSALRCYNCIDRHKYCSKERPKCEECSWKDLVCNYPQDK